LNNVVESLLRQQYLFVADFLLSLTFYCLVFLAYFT